MRGWSAPHPRNGWRIAGTCVQVAGLQMNRDHLSPHTDVPYGPPGETGDAPTGRAPYDGARPPADGGGGIAMVAAGPEAVAAVVRKGLAAYLFDSPCVRYGAAQFPLSDRERQVLALLAEGEQDQDIADALST